MAVNTPIAAGKPLALAIPKLNGKANKNTKNPEIISEFQFSFNPFIPVDGIDILVVVFILYYFFELNFNC
ncbi:MAG: hypothetical protein BroJett020_19020 [Bacteroidota bacterium]|nr:MAG: hypothetical protein BroJett020_19020 [Bacteroidota bacterium]